MNYPVRTRSLPSLEPRRKIPPVKDGVLSSIHSSGRGADFWEGVAGFTRREEALRKDWATSSGSLHKRTALSSEDMHVLAGMGYRGPLFLSLMNRSTKELLLQKQANGNLKQFRTAVRAAELHVGFDDPLVKRMRDCLKDADLEIRALKLHGDNTQTLTDAIKRVGNLDLGRQVWDDPVLAAGRDKYMSWRVSGLQSPRAESRKASCAALAALGNSSSPLQAASMARIQHPASKYASELASLFSDPSYDVRQAAIKACVRIGDAASEEVLAQLNSSEQRARGAACVALGQMGETGAKHADLVAARLRDGDAEVRHLACMAFENFAAVVDGTKYASFVAACLRDPCARVRRSSCFALGSFGGEVAADFIRDFDDLMDDEDEDVRTSASEALRRSGAEGMATLYAAEARNVAAAIAKRKALSSKEDRLEAIEALSAMREDTNTEDAALQYLNDVAACFDDDDAEVRKAAILAFQNFSTADTAHTLADDVAKNLDDEDESIRIAAVNSLMTMNHGSEDHLQAVVDLLDDENKDVRKAVIAAMGNSAEANPTTTLHIMKLANLTKEDCRETQEAAESALANMGQGGIAVTSAMRMDNEDENVRLAAIEALAELDLFKVSEAEQMRRKEEQRFFLELPTIGMPEGSDHDDDLFGPITQRSQMQSVPASVRSLPASARSRHSLKDWETPPRSARSVGSMSPRLRPSPLMVDVRDDSSPRPQNFELNVPDSEEEPASPLSPTTARKFSAARTWRRGALLASAVSAFRKADADDTSSNAQQEVKRNGEEPEQDDQQVEPTPKLQRKIEPTKPSFTEDEQSASSPKTPNKRSKKIRFQEDTAVALVLPEPIDEVVSSPQNRDSPKSPYSPSHDAWHRGYKGVVSSVKAEKLAEGEGEDQLEESMLSEDVDEEVKREREEQARAEEAFQFQTGKTRTRKQGELGKFLKKYGKGDPFAKELLEAKEARKRKEKNEFTALDMYLGAPERCKEYNEILHIAFTGLVSRLRDPSELQRIAACNAFSTFNANANDVAPVVGPLLYDEITEVHMAARHCLVCIGGVGIDLVNKYDREKRAKRKQGICRFIVDSWIKASPPYIEKWAPKDTAFTVNEPGQEESKYQTAVFFKDSEEGKVTRLDTSDLSQYLLPSDNPNFHLSEEELANVKQSKLKFHKGSRSHRATIAH